MGESMLEGASGGVSRIKALILVRRKDVYSGRKDVYSRHKDVYSRHKDVYSGRKDVYSGLKYAFNTCNDRSEC